MYSLLFAYIVSTAAESSGRRLHRKRALTVGDDSKDTVHTSYIQCIFNIITYLDYGIETIQISPKPITSTD